MKPNKTKFKQTEIGMIPEDWEKLKLSEAIDINPKRELKKGVSAKKISMDCLIPFNKKIKSFEISKFYGGSKFINGDTIMARITPCLENGKTAFVDILSDNEVGFGSTEFIVLSGKNGKTIDDFVYYLAISPQLRKEAIKSMTGTSGRQRVQNDLFKEIEVVFPPLPEQRAIAKILSDLDAKIELNQQMNKTLEEIGKAIFKHWFVDFEFPNDEGKPYKSSGGEMEYNEELGKEIPKGWRVRKLHKFGNIICGKTPPKSIKKYFNGHIPFIKIPDMHKKVFIIKTEDSLTQKGEEYQKNKTLPAGSICVSCIATIGLVSITTSKSQTNQQINSIIPVNKELTYYLFYQLKTMKQFLEDLGSGGSATLNINTNIFSNIKIISPPERLLKSFYNLVYPLFSHLLNNEYEILTLTSIRDALLPKLMSGKIRVPV